MNEHEMLKAICDEIGYENEDYSYMIAWDEFMDGTKVYETGFYKSNDDGIAIICNAREIIFTPEFKKAFEKELKNRRLYTEERQNQIDNGDRENYIPDEQIEIQCDYAMFGLLDNLHDPVTYLYNLLFNK